MEVIPNNHDYLYIDIMISIYWSGEHEGPLLQIRVIKVLGQITQKRIVNVHFCRGGGGLQ